jgi:hypothetical protein
MIWEGAAMVAIIVLVAIGIGLVVGLAFWGSNRWSSRSRDREKTADLRAGRDMAASETVKRGTGIN